MNNTPQTLETPELSLNQLLWALDGTGVAIADDEAADDEFYECWPECHVVVKTAEEVFQMLEKIEGQEGFVFLDSVVVKQHLATLTYPLYFYIG